MIWRKNWVLFTELNDTHSEQVEVEYVLNSNNAVESQEIKMPLQKMPQICFHGSLVDTVPY